MYGTFIEIREFGSVVIKLISLFEQNEYKDIREKYKALQNRYQLCQIRHNDFLTQVHFFVHNDYHCTVGPILGSAQD